jgi:threonyl-tRNA synthetase
LGRIVLPGGPSRFTLPIIDLVHVLQCAHIMAMAVQKLHPGAQTTIGPWIERGFYYDFDMKNPLSDEDLKDIKKEMQRIIKADLPFIREEVVPSLSSYRPQKER